MNAAPIVFPSGRYNPSGVQEMFYAFVEDILSMPVLADPETALNFESLVEMASAIVCKTSKQFHKFYGTAEMSELKTNLVGTRDGKGFESTFEITFPGNDPTSMGFLAAAANRQLVLLVREKNKVVRVVGSLEDPAYFETNEYTSGKAIADGRKSVITFKASSATPPPIYKTALTSLLAPAP